jgi:hypothetical protein
VLKYLISTTIQVSPTMVCSDLVCGYDSRDLDKRRPTPGYVFQECKDLLGKFGQVHDEVFYGSQSVLHLTNSPAYQNGQMHRFISQVTNGGRMVHIGANRADMLTQQYS